MKKITGSVIGVNGNMVSVSVQENVSMNEVAYIIVGDKKLKSEVIRIKGNRAELQVFEMTKGIGIGDQVEFSRDLLAVELGPGLLGQIYDGLQNPLPELAQKCGFFLQRGIYLGALSKEKKWEFTPRVKPGESVSRAITLGTVKEGYFTHHIMVPFNLFDSYTVTSIAPEGKYTLKDKIAEIKDSKGHKHEVTMSFHWPVKIPIDCYTSRLKPTEPLVTKTRIIDTFFPIAKGGTYCIPGPFGAGKTVLQQTTSRHAETDIVIVAACGERAGEVVETLKEFPELMDPKTGKSLMERTIIICNTSSMPVAAREASVYTAITIAEYYRNMGLKILLLADSTSRWAQALREMSNRMEELPGQDAYPMDLSAIIANFYSRAGYVELNNGESGSITFIGTVSPAGGNLKEPVTEATKKTARCFYALSQNRADSKRYPAIDPIESYSKYLEYDEVREYVKTHIAEDWVNKVEKTKDVLQRGREVQEQINILGDDGVPVEYHDQFWKSEIIDFIILQQDAFDKVDQLTPFERQKYMLTKVLNICDMQFEFDSFEEVGDFFKRIINQLKQMNYSVMDSDNFKKYEKELESILNERKQG
jgi:V/A-type H+-transporting ATPase subunit A